MPDVKFSNQYPYTDFHELNLDWVISQVKYWSERVGKSIQSIELTGTVGLVDTYTITYSDGSTSTFDVTNGNGIASVAKTGTAGLVDTYTITFQDGSTSTFEVTNGAAAVDPTLTLSGYAADAKVTGDILLPLGETTTQLAATTTPGKYIDFNSLSIGTSWVSALQNNANSVYLAAALDLSNYVGKTLKIVATAWGSGSTRAMGFCDSNNIVSRKYAEANVPNPADLAGFTLIDGKYVAELPISDTHFFFTMSNASNVVQFYVIAAGILDRLNNDYYTKDEINTITGAGTAYVDYSNGDDDDDGSFAHPFKTIQKAITLNYKTILVREGTMIGERIYLTDTNNVRISINKYYSSFDVLNHNINPKVILDGNGSVNIGIYIENCENIIIEGFEIKNTTASGVYVKKSSSIIFRDCISHDIPNDQGFQVLNSNVDFIDCGAYNIGTYGGGLHRDGFNLHGTGIQNLVNCWANYCEDDGVSHHDACEGYVDGGEWHHCGKGGVATPTHGAKINVQNVYVHDCDYGIYASNDYPALAKTFNLTNCVLKDNTTTDIFVNNNSANIWNCIYNTISHSGTGSNNIIS